MKKENRILTYSLLLMVFVLVMSSCNKETEDEITPDSSQLVIGKSYQGGIIAYLLEPGDSSYNANVPHGLIAAPSDQSTGIYWHATNTGTTGATGFSIGTGNSNTNKIIALYGTEMNAARICYDLVLGGYSDWFLPSKDELNQLWINRVAVGGFANAYYWSSTENSIYGAWKQVFSNGTQGHNSKNLASYVRAVRAF